MPNGLDVNIKARGSTRTHDAHGCAKLKNDPDLCKLVKRAAIGWV